MNIRKKMFSIGRNIIIGMIIFAIVFTPVTTSAALTGVPFGGIIVIPIPCICSLGLLIHIIPIGHTSPPAVIFTFGSILYAFYNLFRPGTYLLGNYDIPLMCWILIPAPPFCIPYPLMPIAPRILDVGTSM
jgi:hypothetical protein